jgi:hypothetical protein
MLKLSERVFLTLHLCCQPMQNTRTNLTRSPTLEDVTHTRRTCDLSLRFDIAAREFLLL